MTDIRWLQRFENYKKALIQMTEAIELINARALSNIEKQGFIKAFEFTHELAWKVLKDFANYQGDSQIMGSRDATRYGFANQIIKDGETWMQMIVSRNKAVHSYDEQAITQLIGIIKQDYFELFKQLQVELEKLKSKKP